MIHEGSPALGPQYKDLPATVREISRSTLFGKHAHNFVASLGAQTEFQLQRSGNLYICTHQGYEVEVSMCQVDSVFNLDCKLVGTSLFLQMCGHHSTAAYI